MHYINFVLSAALAGGLVAVAVPGKRWPRRVAALCLLVLFLWSWPPFAKLTSETLERGYTTGPADTAGCGAIVVLSGSILLPNASRPVPLMGLSTYVRCAHAAWLYHRHPLPVVATGGSVEAGGVRVAAAEVMRNYLLSQGVTPIWTEEQSFSTAQNAANTVRLLRARGISRIVLVTEAYHMPRAARCFEKLGMPVVPAPCSFNTLEPLGWTSIFPDSRALRINEDNFHEWAGLLWYRLRGVA
jgi:uncharacterized SAM-binding protein YcdF (DUF218 family)